MQTKMKIMAAALSAVLAGGLGTAAFAQMAGAGMGPFADFAKADANGDGQVTQDEIAALQKARQAEIDTDKNGTFSVDELIAERILRATERATAQVPEWVASHDKNGDNALSAEEMPGPRDFTRMFKRVDANGDGSISLAEAEEAKGKMQRHHRKHRRDDSE